MSPQKSVRMRRKWDPCTLLAGMQNGTVTVGNCMQALHKLKAELPCLSNHVPENISKVLIKIRTLRRLYITMVIAHHPRPLKMEGRKKMWCMWTAKYELGLKRKKCSYGLQCGYTLGHFLKWHKPLTNYRCCDIPLSKGPIQSHSLKMGLGKGSHGSYHLVGVKFQSWTMREDTSTLLYLYLLCCVG